MQRGDIDVRDVHGHLRYPVFVYIPADGLASFESARYHHRLAVCVFHYLAGYRVAFSFRTAFLPHIECHGIGPACGSGVQVEVHRYQEVPCPHIGGSASGCPSGEFSRAEVRSLVRVGHLFRKSLIFTGPAHCKIFPFRLVCSRLIAVAWDLQFIINALSQFSCQLSAFFECDSCHRDERQHICRSGARMRPVMMSHVNQLSCPFYTHERRFRDGFRRAGECHHRPVGGLARIHIQYLHSAGFLYGGHYGVNYFPVPALAEIRHAFYYPFHNYVIFQICQRSPLSSLWIASPLRSFGSNHVVFGGMMFPESAMSTSCFMDTG